MSSQEFIYLRHLQSAAGMEVRYREKENMINDLRQEKNELEHHLSKMTEDLHRCMRALHTIASVEMAKDGGCMSEVTICLHNSSIGRMSNKLFWHPTSS